MFSLEPLWQGLSLSLCRGSGCRGILSSSSFLLQLQLLSCDVLFCVWTKLLPTSFLPHIFIHSCEISPNEARLLLTYHYGIKVVRVQTTARWAGMTHTVWKHTDSSGEANSTCCTQLCVVYTSSSAFLETPFLILILLTLESIFKTKL